MNLPFFIARRYLISKKSRNIINLISWVSMAGIGVASMALILVLSVFNGLEGLIKSLFSSFDPQIKITLAEGKVFEINEDFTPIKNHEATAVFAEVVEENALVRYREGQVIVTLKGVEENYRKLTGIDSLIVEGSFQLYEDGRPTSVVGYELAAQLGVGLNFFDPMHFYVPKRTGGLSINAATAFNRKHLFPRGKFSVQQEYDSKYIFVPLDFAQDLLAYDNQVTAVELKLRDGYKASDIKEEYQELLGTNYLVQTQEDLHQAFYQVMASEKWAIFLILGFILIIASFNTISSLTLLVLEKRSDMHILQTMGFRTKDIKRTFLNEGLMISCFGALIGILLGTLIGLIQIQFGILRFPSSGSFIVDAYPLKLLFTDYLLVGGMVGVIGWIASYTPVRILGKRYFSSFDGTALKA